MEKPGPASRPVASRPVESEISPDRGIYSRPQRPCENEIDWSNFTEMICARNHVFFVIFYGYLFSSKYTIHTSPFRILEVIQKSAAHNFIDAA
jgi:hypothetical protein